MSADASMGENDRPYNTTVYTLTHIHLYTDLLLSNIMRRSFFAITKVSRNGGPKGSHVFTIPAEICHTLNVNQGDRFIIGIDDEGRIVYERIESKITCQGESNFPRLVSQDTLLSSHR